MRQPSLSPFPTLIMSSLETTPTILHTNHAIGRKFCRDRYEQRLCLFRHDGHHLQHQPGGEFFQASSQYSDCATDRSGEIIIRRFFLSELCISRYIVIWRGSGRSPIYNQHRHSLGSWSSAIKLPHRNDRIFSNVLSDKAKMHFRQIIQPDIFYYWKRQ